MARIETILSELPRLISERSDSRKIETAIRYMGDVLFDTSQNPKGDKAKWLAKLLASPASIGETKTREAILTLFRDGYLDRYSELSAWKDIGAAVGLSPSAISGILSIPEAGAAAASPKIVSVPQIVTPPPMPKESPYSGSEADGKAEEVSLEPAPTAKAAIDALPDDLPKLQPSQSMARAGTATTSLEITCLEATNHNAYLFAKNFKTSNEASYLSLFPCLTGFQPEFSPAGGSVEWVNPVTGDRFVDDSRKLTGTSPSRLTLRAMLELARAENWLKVSVQGSLRIQTLAQATAVEIDRAAAPTQILDKSAISARTAAPTEQIVAGRSRFSRPITAAAAFLAGLLSISLLLWRFEMSTVMPRTSSAHYGMFSDDVGGDLLLENLSCTVGHDGSHYSIAVTGKVKNSGSRTITAGYDAGRNPAVDISVSVSRLPGRWTPQLIRVFLPRIIRAGQVSILKVVKPMAAIDESVNAVVSADGQFVGHLAASLWVETGISYGNGVSFFQMPTYSRTEQPCYFSVKSPEVPQPPEGCRLARFKQPSESKEGDCVQIWVEPGYLRWTSANEAIFLRDRDQPLALEFSSPPESVNEIWATRDGTSSYVNEFSVKIDVPRFNVMINAPAQASSRIEIDPSERAGS